MAGEFGREEYTSPPNAWFSSFSHIAEAQRMAREWMAKHQQ